MVDIPRMPPGRRFFARLDRFEVACPHCGRLVFAAIDRRFLPKRLQQRCRARANAKERPRAESVLRMFFNPYTQRWQCPWCEHVYMAGIVFYPVRYKGRRHPPAPDCEPTPDEVAELRRLAGGWFVKGIKAPGDWANLHVEAECSCPYLGTDPACALHGNLVLGATPAGTSEGGESE